MPAPLHKLTGFTFDPDLLSKVSHRLTKCKESILVINFICLLIVVSLSLTQVVIWNSSCLYTTEDRDRELTFF